MYDINVDLAMRITQYRQLILLIGFGLFFVVILIFQKTHSSVSKNNVFEFFTDPIEIKANSKPVDLMKGIETNLYSNGEFTVPMDGYIKSYNPEAVNAPKESMRYTYAFKVGKKDPVCDKKDELAHVVSIEYNEMHYYSKFGYGYKVSKGDKIHFSSAFANFSNTDLKNVHTKFLIEIADLSENLIPVTPVYLNAVPCTSMFFVPAKTKDYVKSMETPYEVPFDSKLIMAGSHGHNYTDTISLVKNGKPIWTTGPLLTDNGMNAGNPIYLNVGGIGYANDGVRFKKGDKLSVSIKMSNPKDTQIDAMGTMLIFLIPDSGDLIFPGAAHW